MNINMCLMDVLGKKSVILSGAKNLAERSLPSVILSGAKNLAKRSFYLYSQNLKNHLKFIQTNK